MDGSQTNIAEPPTKDGRPVVLQVVPRLVTGQFDPTANKALWPSTGNYARGGIAIDASNGNRISELLFRTFDPIDDSPAKITADLEALPGELSWYFGPIDGAAPLIADAPDEQMALGSTFKLYVLATLGREVAQGKRAWDDVVTLGAPRSYPSGMMQDWPQDAPVTLHTLASLMISISDNTATDALIDLLGRQAVYRTVIESGHAQPERSDPFLTTREMFLLKGGPAGRLEAYQAADSEGRLFILDGIPDLSVPANQIEAAFSEGPRALDVEWFASTRDLARLFTLMRETADPEVFAIMAINPAMPDNVRENWAYTGYKGGSEPGVLNLTWLLTDSSGKDHMLALSWTNSQANVDSTTLELIAHRILALPR